MKPYYEDASCSIYNGSCLDILTELPEKSVNCCVTSPPYWGLRDYGNDGQLGLEQTPEEYVENMVKVFSEVKRVLRDDGTLWLNLGDSYNAGRNGGHSGGQKQASLDRHKGIDKSGANVDGLKPKDLVGIPWRVAFALQADGWYLRQDIIWHKPNPMPESVTDRCTKAHEYIFLLSKSKSYYYDSDAIKEKASPDSSLRDRDSSRLNNTPGRTKMGGLTKNDYEQRNKRSVWTVNTKPYKEAHFAVFPSELIYPCILAGCPKGGTVLEPFMGSGTTLHTAKDRNRKSIGIELNPDYCEIAVKRLAQEYMDFS